ncbi:MAG: hypothetical protein RBR33_00560 [Sulfurovaceae bacterium]|nr:hypothetical protein [Sulfurovaceae bacterium]
MKELEDKIICQCGDKSIKQAIEIFSSSSLPYKKAKKLVTQCNHAACCRDPLMRLFKMVKSGKIDYEEIDLLMEQIDTKKCDIKGQENV